MGFTSRRWQDLGCGHWTKLKRSWTPLVWRTQRLWISVWANVEMNRSSVRVFYTCWAWSWSWYRVGSGWVNRGVSWWKDLGFSVAPGPSHTWLPVVLPGLRWMHTGRETGFLQENQLFRSSIGTQVKSPDLIHAGWSLLWEPCSSVYYSQEKIDLLGKKSIGSVLSLNTCRFLSCHAIPSFFTLVLHFAR